MEVEGAGGKQNKTLNGTNDKREQIVDSNKRKERKTQRSLLRSRANQLRSLPPLVPDIVIVISRLSVWAYSEILSQ